MVGFQLWVWRLINALVEGGVGNDRDVTADLHHKEKADLHHKEKADLPDLPGKLRNKRPHAAVKVEAGQGC